MPRNSIFFLPRIFGYIDTELKPNYNKTLANSKCDQIQLPIKIPPFRVIANQNTFFFIPVFFNKKAVELS